MKLLFTILFCLSLQAQTTYKLNGIGYITIPHEMELQDEAYRQKARNYAKEYQLLLNENRVIFQQRGLNKSEPIGSQTYARIIIEVEYGNFGYDVTISSQEYEEINSTLKKNAINSLSQLQNMKLLQWNGVSNVKIDGVLAIKYSYIRQLGSNPSVYVETYIVLKGKKRYIFTFSYRVNDKEIWQPIYSKILNSLQIE